MIWIIYFMMIYIMSIEILPRLWIGLNPSVAKDRDFFINNNIKYVINLTYDIPNYFRNITYFNVPISNENFNESELIMSSDQLFDVINKFISQGYNYDVGILIHDKNGKLSALVASGFLMGVLKISHRDIYAYLKIHGFNNPNYISHNLNLINYEKKNNIKQCITY
jgi:hypothetical protein